VVFDIYNDDYILQEGGPERHAPGSIEKESRWVRVQRENSAAPTRPAIG